MRRVNLDGDEQADLTVHGGPDKAVYAYAIEETRMGGGARPGARGRRVRREPDHRRGRRLRGGDRRALADRHDAARGRAAAVPLLQARDQDGRSGLRPALRPRPPGRAPTCGSSRRATSAGATRSSIEGRPDTASPAGSSTTRSWSTRSLVPRALAAPQLIPSLRRGGSIERWPDEAPTPLATRRRGGSRPCRRSSGSSRARCR